MKQITNIRKAVCTMANELKKEGYTLSQAFRKAWRRIKLSMKIRAVGTTAGNIQERLAFIKQFPVDTMQAELVREPENPFDKNAIKIVVHLRSINRKTVIGYVPRGLAAGLAAVIDAGVNARRNYCKYWAAIVTRRAMVAYWTSLYRCPKSPK